MTAEHDAVRNAGPRRRPGATETSKRRIFAAALELMGRYGVSATTVDDIAEAAGLAKGTVYYNFGSKTKMVGELLRYGFDLLLTELAAGRERVGPGRERLEEMMRAALAFVRDYPNYLHLWISHAWRQDSPWLADSAHMRAELLRVVEQELATLPARRDDVDPAVVAASIVGTLVVLSQEQLVFGIRRSRAEQIAALMLVIEGYSTPAAPAGT